MAEAAERHLQFTKLCARLTHGELVKVLATLAKETGTVERALQLGAMEICASGVGDFLVHHYYHYF